MKVLVLGATGMVGQATVRECLADPEVTELLVIGRASIETKHAKLREIVRKDLYDLSDVEKYLEGVDACLFCLGVSAAGMSEEQYRRITYDLTLAVAKTLRKTSPNCTFVYITGAGTDPKGGAMWARVKGETEEALLALGFPRAYMFRPGYIQPMHGVSSKTRLYAAIYFVMSPLYPLLVKLFPKLFLTSEEVGKAMLKAGLHGAPKPILEIADIQALVR